MKLIIAVRGPHDNGKSSVIKETINLLGKKYAITTNIGGYDRNVNLNINNVLIGIESQGDPGSRMQTSLKNFIKQGCDIILIACRTKGDTVKAIIQAHKKNNYEIVWAPNCSSTDSALFAQLNTEYATWAANVIEQSALTGVITV